MLVRYAEWLQTRDKTLMRTQIFGQIHGLMRIQNLLCADSGCPPATAKESGEQVSEQAGKNKEGKK